MSSTANGSGHFLSEINSLDPVSKFFQTNIFIRLVATIIILGPINQKLLSVAQVGSFCMIFPNHLRTPVLKVLSTIAPVIF